MNGCSYGLLYTYTYSVKYGDLPIFSRKCSVGTNDPKFAGIDNSVQLCQIWHNSKVEGNISDNAIFAKMKSRHKVRVRLY